MKRLLNTVTSFLWLSTVACNTQKTVSQDNGAASTPTIISHNDSNNTPSVTLAVSSSTTKPRNSTCPNRTVNYITHILPQQCLRTNRAPYNSTVPSVESSATVISSNSASSDSRDFVASIITASADSGIEIHAPRDSTTTTGTSASILSSATGASLVTSNQDGHGPTSASEEESDSPLDTANFLSFEEWKKQNLAKLGQSPEDVGRSQPVNPNRPRPGINNALESLGDESELDLDFAGFGSVSSSSASEDYAKASVSDAEGPSSIQVSGSHTRSKDAGKTCKERTNYASFDCSATVLKSNKECKSASSVLVESKDSYMLNTCSAKNKFVIVQLCNDIQIDTIVLANYEFFSATFRHFRVSVSDRYPVEIEKWRDLGTFEGRNTREIQAFLVENPLIWAKYLRIEFLSHYGTEYYCPVTLLRVHGTTMIEDYRREEDLARGEQVQLTLEAEAIGSPPLTNHYEQSATESKEGGVGASPHAEQSTEEPEARASTSTSNGSPDATVPTQSSSSQETLNIGTAEKYDTVTASRDGAYEPPNTNVTFDNSATGTSKDNKSIEVTVSDGTSNRTAKREESAPLNARVSSKDQGSQSTAINVGSTSTMNHSIQMATPGNQPMVQDKSSQSALLNNTPSAVSAPPHSSSSTSAVDGSQPSASINATRSTVSSSQSAQAPQPSSQESFFKSFHKRLQQLESNSTLSLKYIEEQSRILRDAFSKVEKRQVTTTSKFLSQLNETVMAELHGFKQAYDQLWQGTVIELEGQREAYQREMLALSSRLTLVADELVWQKRMGIVQSTLLLLCLAMALFGRSSNGYLEVPLMQQIAALKGGWESPPDSPSPDSRSPVSLFRKRIWRAKTEPVLETSNLTDSEPSRPQTQDGPNVRIQPPSPTSNDPVRTYDEFEDEDNTSSDAPENGVTSGKNSVSPKKNRKKANKLPDWPHGNDRMRSPLAM